MAVNPEAHARQTIDAALRQAGWDVQDSRRVNVNAALGVAIREFPLQAGYGTADYLLYVNGKAAGVLLRSEGGSPLPLPLQNRACDFHRTRLLSSLVF